MNKHALRAAAVGVLALGLVAGTATTAMAAPGDPLNPQPNGSEGGVFFWDANTGEVRETPGYVYAYNEGLVAAGSGTDFLAPTLCPPTATGAYAFVTQPGTERTGVDGWQAYRLDALIGGNVSLADMTLENQADGAPAPIKANGGTW